MKSQTSQSVSKSVPPEGTGEKEAETERDIARERERGRRQGRETEGKGDNPPPVSKIKKGKHEATRKDGRMLAVSHPHLLFRGVLS